MKLADQSRPDTRSATIVQALGLILGCSAVFAVTTYATTPGWWSGVLNTNPQNDHAVVVEGQLKYFTQQAVAEMNTDLPGGSGTTLSNMVYNWQADFTAHGESTNDFQDINVGQLKYIGNLYYTQLAADGYTAAWPNWLYPNPATDSQLAVIGQLKTLFDFDPVAALVAPSNVTATVQSDGSVDVSWTESSPNVTGFTIQRNDGSGWVTISSGSTTPDITDYTVSSADAGTAGVSQFRVVANNTSNSTSATSSAVTPPASSSAPTPPSNLTVAAVNSTSFQLNWQDNSGGTAGFVIKGSKDGGSTWTELDAVGTGVTSDTVKPNPSYLWIFQVFAQQSGGLSGGTDIVSGDGVDTDQVPQYALIDIGPGASGPFINDSGQVVYYGTSGSSITGWFWNQGRATQIMPPSSPSGITLGTVAGLNNSGTVAVSLIYPDDTNSVGADVGNHLDQGTALWNGSCSPLDPVPDLLTSTLTDYNGDTGPPDNGASSLGVFIKRQNEPQFINDSGTIIGWASEQNYGLPYWSAGVPIENNNYFANIMIYPLSGAEWPQVLSNGRTFGIVGFNNSGTVIGSYYDTAILGSEPVVDYSSTNYFYGSPSAPHVMNGVPMTINDNGDIVGTDSSGMTSVVWLGSAREKIINYSGTPSYINNEMQAANGWQDYRLHNLSNLLATPDWSLGWSPSPYPSGSAISHNTGIIFATATQVTNSDGTPIPSPEWVAHMVELLPVQLDQVTFSGSGTPAAGQYDVYDDTTITYNSTSDTYTAQKFSAEHGTNQWQGPEQSATDTAHKFGWADPICFSSGSTMTAAVQFKVSPGASVWSSLSLKIKGVGTGTASTGYNFPSTTATYNSTSNTITASGMTCSQAFPSATVGYINPLTIQWSISTDGGSSWNAIKQSTNECFVTLNAPTSDPTGDGNYKLFQTVLYYACSNSGATTAAGAVANTWSLFSSGGTGPTNITKWNPSDKKYDQKLYYYGASRGFEGLQPVTTTALLAASDGDGECYSFGQLFQDALWANGISNTGIKITPIVTGEAFLVKDLTPSATGSLPADAPFSWEMTFSASVQEMQPPPSTATTYGTYGDFINLSTHQGQNTAPPLEKLFGNHYIVQYGSGYYDPSYGVTYTSANNFEDESVQGYCVGISGDTVDLAVEPSAGLHNIQFQSQNQPHQ